MYYVSLSFFYIIHKKLPYLPILREELLCIYQRFRKRLCRNPRGIPHEHPTKDRLYLDRRICALKYQRHLERPVHGRARSCARYPTIVNYLGIFFFPRPRINCVPRTHLSRNTLNYLFNNLPYSHFKFT